MALTLTRWIIKRHPNGFLGATIEGERGYGKSAYAMKIMKEVYQQLYGLDEWEAWNKAVEMMKFKLEEIIELIYNTIHNDNMDMIPVFCWDDAGVHAGSYRYFTNLREVILLHGLMDTVRSAVTGFLLTTPNRQLLLSFLRKYEDYGVKIGSMDGAERWQRIARGYKNYRLPDGKKRVRKMYEDYYSCYIPNNHNYVKNNGGIRKDIYDMYMERRNRYLKEVTSDMKVMMDSLKKD